MAWLNLRALRVGALRSYMRITTGANTTAQMTRMSKKIGPLDMSLRLRRNHTEKAARRGVFVGEPGQDRQMPPFAQETLTRNNSPRSISAEG